MPVNELWEEARDILKDELSTASYTSFIEELLPVALNDRTIVLQAADDFMRKTLSERYLETVQDALKQVAGNRYFVRFITPAERSFYERPAEEECELVLRAVGARAGISLRGLTAAVNLRDGCIKKTVDFLLHEGAVYRDEKKYYLSPRGYRYNREHYEKVTQVRRREFAQMRALTTTKECYLKHLVNCLDDRSAQPCGKCANCLGSPLIGESISPQTLDAALSYLDHLLIPIRPRKRRADEPADGSTVIAVGNREGVCLSKYGEAGYGRFVREDKYRGERFRDELIRKSAKVLKKLAADGGITHLAFVPSLRSGLVKDLAVRLADACGLQLLDVLKKSAAPPQKEQQNSAHQCRNAYTSFGIAAEACIPYHILLIDDIVDSGWTLTACGQLLRERGALSVTPFALADSSEREGS